MKNIILLTLLLPLLAGAQKIYTVSNIPGSGASFKTLQGAHDSVAAGSILYVLPSSFSYGNAVFTKKLTVYGTGYFLGQNTEPNTQANTAPVTVNSITFKPGSDNSFVEGLQMVFQAQEVTNRFVLDTVSNITISRCLIISPTWGAYGAAHSFFYINGANNCLIRQCYIQNINGYTNPPAIQYKYSTYPNFSGIQFLNNIFDWQPTGNNAFRFGPDTYGGFKAGGIVDLKIINNTFLTILKYSAFGNLNYTNNIFYNASATDIVVAANVYLNGTNMNNISNSATLFPVGGNNYQNPDADSIFVATLSGAHSIDQKWMIRDNSFANTFGLGGIACGAFGGTAPYKLSGIPNIPFIYSLNVPSQGTAPGSILVHIKAHASN